jgi:hypothetical protein
MSASSLISVGVCVGVGLGSAPEELESSKLFDQDKVIPDHLQRLIRTIFA